MSINRSVKSTENTNLMSGSCHLDRASNVEIGVECQIKLLLLSSLTAAELYNLGYIQGIIRVH